MTELAHWLERLKPSATVAVNRRARALRAAGREIVNFGIGAPDFDTPHAVKEAAIAAIRGGETRYTNVDGTPALKEAIRRKFERDHGLAFSPDEISVGTGAKQVVFNALLVSLDAGDEVIVPAPYYTSYPDIARIADAVPRVVPCGADAGFKLDAGSLRAALGPRTKWLVLNSPGNPSGAVYSADELATLADVLREHPRVSVLSDDIYEHYVFDGRTFVTFSQVAPDLKERTLTVNGVSKTYGMTGWRIGYAAGPQSLVRAMARLQSQSITSLCSISQAAAVAALTGPQAEVATLAPRFQARRDLMVSLLAHVPGFRCSLPEGSFYAFPECASLIGRKTPDGATIASDTDLAAYLLEHAGVATVPGAGFGASPHLRLSFAVGEDEIRSGCERLKAACQALS